jgi:hypothetical protein
MWNARKLNPRVPKPRTHRGLFDPEQPENVVLTIPRLAVGMLKRWLARKLPLAAGGLTYSWSVSDVGGSPQNGHWYAVKIFIIEMNS